MRDFFNSLFQFSKYRIYGGCFFFFLNKRLVAEELEVASFPFVSVCLVGETQVGCKTDGFFQFWCFTRCPFLLAAFPLGSYFLP